MCGAEEILQSFIGCGLGFRDGFLCRVSGFMFRV